MELLKVSDVTEWIETLRIALFYLLSRLGGARRSRQLPMESLPKYPSNASGFSKSPFNGAPWCWLDV